MCSGRRPPHLFLFLTEAVAFKFTTPAGWLPLRWLPARCHISSDTRARLILAEQQSLLVQMNLLGLLELEKSAFLHNSAPPPPPLPKS